MRPVRLSMQAFGPYAGRETIDFREVVEAGLFGVYGPTGSGKSTIFSAMTFALFGEAAREEQEAPSLRSDHADAETATEVEFVFDLGEKRYVVVRRPEQMRPKQRGEGFTRDLAEAWLFDATGLSVDAIEAGNRGTILEEKKTTVVRAAVEELLGYGPEQFRQIVLLPQGRFETFLAAKTRDRLGILRDLFDVSLYRRLTARFKESAAEVEREVRDQRAICAGRLNAEGFESTDALIEGIEQADILLKERSETENAQITAAKVARDALEAARQMEAKFQAAETAENILTALRERNAEIDVLAERLNKAERARFLLDLETQLNGAKSDVVTATEECGRKQNAAERTAAIAKSAAEANDAELARASEIDALRREIDALKRHVGVVDRSVDAARAVEDAASKVVLAQEGLKVTHDKLDGLLGAKRSAIVALKFAQEADRRRLELHRRLAELEAELKAARAFETAERDLAASTEQIAEIARSHEIAIGRVNTAQDAYDRAEQDLSNVQALHLATKLVAGEPCPVCGATDHPAPALGHIENAGLDPAFRQARAALAEIQAVERDADRRLTTAKGVAAERRDRLDALDRPTRQAVIIQSEADACRVDLTALGPEAESAEIEASIERLDGENAVTEAERDRFRAAVGKMEVASASAQARLEELLSSVPADLRDRTVLDARIADRQTRLTAREAARDAKAKAATETRETALGAEKDLHAARQALAAAQNRLDQAQAAFTTRLADTGLTEDDFISLKPAIATIAEDRAEVEEHRRKLANAVEEEGRAQAAIAELERPDLDAASETVRLADDALMQATNARAEANAALLHLHKLQDELAEALRRLDELETESGPLRDLAALFDAKNSLNLDLETFAIGAMFDAVLDAANRRLVPMSGHRYTLERELEAGRRGRRGLGIQVFDVHTGKSRPTATLSGGETFIAALALALGLADVVESASGKVRLDTIFIDEGFGSLDTENGSGTLDTVLQALQSLVSQNRAVGLISHVPLVQEMIPNGFYVRKELAGSSVETKGMS